MCMCMCVHACCKQASFIEWFAPACRALQGEPYATGRACFNCPEEAPDCVANLCGELRERERERERERVYMCVCLYVLVSMWSHFLDLNCVHGPKELLVGVQVCPLSDQISFVSSCSTVPVSSNKDAGLVKANTKSQGRHSENKDNWYTYQANWHSTPTKTPWLLLIPNMTIP